MIYLDNAATSYHEPAAVAEAVVDFLAQAGNPGRSGHSLARTAEKIIWSTREALATYFSMPDPAQVVFTATRPRL